MSHFPDINAALALVVERLVEADVEAAVNTGEVNPPGAWVRLSPTAPFPVDLLSGEAFVGVEVLAVVGAMPLADAHVALRDVADAVVEVLGYPDAAVRAQATLLGDSPVALPTLVLPYYVATTPEGNPA